MSTSLRRFAAALLAGCASVRAQDFDLALPPPPSAARPSFSAGTLLTPVESLVGKTRPVLYYSYAEVDGLLSAPGVQSDSSVQTVAVTFSAEFAESVVLQYTPAWSAYSNNVFDDTFSHDLVARAGLNLTEWEAAFVHRYFHTAVPLAETGRQSAVEAHATSAHAQRPLGQKTDLAFGIRQNLRSVDGFFGHREWIGDSALHYRFSPVLKGSGAFAYGYVDVENGANMTFQQLQSGLEWQPTRAIRLNVRAGLETRDTSNGAFERTSTPIYGAGLAYQPIETTSFVIGANRQLSASFLQNRLVRTQAWNAGITQRLLGRFHLSLSWANRTRAYRATNVDLPTQREDRGRLFQASLSTPFRTRGNIAIFYHHSRNRSTQSAFNLDTSQTGLEFTYRF